MLSAAAFSIVASSPSSYVLSFFVLLLRQRCSGDRRFLRIRLRHRRTSAVSQTDSTSSVDDQITNCGVNNRWQT